jgi:hypothetical protein
MDDDPKVTAAQLPDEIRDAVETLGGSIESEVSDILRAAEARGADLERDARRSAREVEQEAQRKAERILQAALERAAAVLDSIDAIQDGLVRIASGLRAESDALTAKLTTEYEDAAGALPRKATGEPHPALEELGQGPSQLSDAVEIIPTGQLRSAVRATLYRMRQEGQPREAGERFLARFRIEDPHGDLLEEVYGNNAEDGSAAGRSGRKRGRLFRRR